MKTIILPTDFFFFLKNAIRFTIDMYGTENVRYVLVNAYGMHHNSSAMMINLDDYANVVKLTKATLLNLTEDIVKRN